jgi:hypothetical protein
MVSVEMVKKMNEDVCDILFDDILRVIHYNERNIKKEIDLQVGRGLPPETVICAIHETTFYRAPDSLLDCRSTPTSNNPELTLEDDVRNKGWLNQIAGQSGTKYKISQVLKNTDCLYLISHYFGPKAYCYMKRQRILADSQYHVYCITIYVRMYPTDRTLNLANKIKIAWENHTARNFHSCDYCGVLVKTTTLIEGSYCSAKCHYDDHVPLRF